MNVIGLDVGTTGISGIVLDSESGQVVKIASRENDTFLRPAYDFEKIQSPEKIMEKIFSILDELGTDSVGAIGVTGQMHGIVYTDITGRAVSPLYIWQDGRGQCLSKSGKTYAEALGSYTGYGNVTNLYNKEHGLIQKDAVCFCTIHDYVVMQLTGQAAPLVHISDAASFGCFDLQEKRFTLEEPMLPKVTEGTKIAGHFRGIPVSIAIGDNQASFLGCGCKEGDLLINIGTGAQISMITEQTYLPDELEIRPLTESCRIAVGSSLCGGRAYAMLEGFFRQVLEMAGVSAHSLYNVMEQTARETGTTTLCFETFFCGTRTQPKKRASITELSADNFTPGDVVLACLGGILGELHTLYSQCGITAQRIIASGNGVRKNSLMHKLMEEVFGMKVVIPCHREEAAYGAALFALTASGYADSIAQAQNIVQYLTEEEC